MATKFRGFSTVGQGHLDKEIAATEKGAAHGLLTNELTPMTSEKLTARQPGVPERRQTPAVVTVFVVAFLVCLWVNGRWLWLHEVPRSPAEDLAKHLAMAINFRAAVAEGQFLPRIQPGGEILSDMPLFQYYGFFEGLAAWPFLRLGLSGLHAIIVAIVLLRWLAFATVYLTGRILRAGPAASALAGFAYILSPYLINNQLSRVAISEVHAHSLLPICLLGWALIQRGQRPLGSIVIAFGMTALALAHNIFFLYAAVLLAVLGLCSLSDWRATLATALGGLSGVLVAGAQWYPALLSQPDFVLNLTKRTEPFQFAGLVSWSGLWGWPKPLRAPLPNGGSISYFFTFPWWTLPIAAGLLWSALHASGRRMMAFSLLAAGTVFLLLTTPPVDFWAVLPTPFAALQFTYRLIAFIAVLGATGIAVAFPGLSWSAFLALLPLMIFSQWRVIHTDSLHLGNIGLSEQQIASSFASGDFACMSPPKAPPSELCYSNGTLQEKNHFRSGFAAKPDSKLFLEFAGYNESPGSLKLSLVSLNQAGEVVAASTPSEFILSPGAFSVGLPLDPTAVDHRLVCAWQGQSLHSADGIHPQPIQLRSALPCGEATALLLPRECLAEGTHVGYRRSYRILPTEVGFFGPLGNLRAGDGWLREDNVINSELRTLRLHGINGLTDVVKLFAAKPGEPEKPQTAVYQLPPGPFDITLPLAGLPVPLRIYYSPYMIPHVLNPVSTDNRKLALTLEQDSLKLDVSSYTSFIVQTPIAYNRFWKVLHDGKPVPTFSDALYHLCVKLPRPSGVLTMRYHVPWLTWALTLVGTLLCGLAPLLWKTLDRHFPSLEDRQDPAPHVPASRLTP